jgi:hypothetical protein
MGIDAHQLAIMIGVAVAGAGRARLDVAHHRASIAADLVGGSSRISQHEQALEAGVKLSNAQSVAMQLLHSWPALHHSTPGHFVRIRTMLRAPQKTVKRALEAKSSFAE